MRDKNGNEMRALWKYEGKSDMLVAAYTRDEAWAVLSKETLVLQDPSKLSRITGAAVYGSARIIKLR